METEIRYYFNEKHYQKLLEQQKITRNWSIKDAFMS